MLLLAWMCLVVSACADPALSSRMDSTDRAAGSPVPAEVVWEARVDGRLSSMWGASAMQDLTGPVLAVGRQLIVRTAGDPVTVVCLALETGEIRWIHELPGYELDHPGWSAWWVEDGTLHLAGRIDLATGEVLAGQAGGAPAPRCRNVATLSYEGDRVLFSLQDNPPPPRRGGVTFALQGELSEVGILQAVAAGGGVLWQRELRSPSWLTSHWDCGLRLDTLVSDEAGVVWITAAREGGRVLQALDAVTGEPVAGYTFPDPWLPTCSPDPPVIGAVGSHIYIHNHPARELVVAAAGTGAEAWRYRYTGRLSALLPAGGQLRLLHWDCRDDQTPVETVIVSLDVNTGKPGGAFVAPGFPVIAVDGKFLMAVQDEAGTALLLVRTPFPD